MKTHIFVFLFLIFTVSCGPDTTIEQQKYSCDYENCTRCEDNTCVRWYCDSEMCASCNKDVCTSCHDDFRNSDWHVKPCGSTCIPDEETCNEN